MAFPTGWAGYDTPSALAAPSSSLSDFTYLISLDQMSATWWANVKSDGGDIRATKSDGTTELPVDLIEFDYGGESGLIAVKYSGTQATSPDDILIWCGNASATLPAASDTYGQYNAWPSAVFASYPSGGGNDRTVNANHLTMTGSPTVGGAAGPINGSKATDYNGSGQYGVNTSPTNLATAVPLSLMASINTDLSSGFAVPLSLQSGDIDFNGWYLRQRNLGFRMQTAGGGQGIAETSLTLMSTATWYSVIGVSATNANRSIDVSGTVATDTTSRTPSSIDRIMVGAADFAPISNYWDGRLSFVVARADAISSEWTDYWQALLADPDQSDFYGTWSWTAAGGGGTDDLTATGIATGAPTVGTPAIGQVHALTATGVATGSPSTGSPALGQVHDLTATGIATGAPTVGTPTLTEGSTTDNLTADGIATGSPTVGSPAIGQAHAITATGVATGAPSTGSPALGQVHDLTATGIATGAPTVGTPSMAGEVAMSATGIATGAPTIGNPTLGQIHAIATAGIATGAPSVGAPILSQVHVLTATPIVLGEITIGIPALNEDVFTSFPRSTLVAGHSESHRVLGINRSTEVVGDLL